MQKAFEEILKIDPAKIAEYTVETLVKFFDLIRQVQGILEVMRKEIGSELLGRFEGDGTIVGEFSVVRAKRPSFSKVTMDTAREFGAVKESIDTDKLSKLMKKGIEVPGVTFTEYVLVNSLTKSEEEGEVQ
jgi:hypothetical protein